MQTKYKDYLEDLIPILKNELKTIKTEKIKGEFSNGMIQEFHNMLLYIQKLLSDNQIPLELFDLKDITSQTHTYSNWDSNQKPTIFRTIVQQIVKFLQSNSLAIKQNQHTEELFKQGQLQATYVILSIMQEQAELSFNINLKTIGLEELQLSDYA